jgi:hypothetical protein
MKTSYVLLLHLLFTLSVNAQSFISNLNTTVDSINGILDKAKMVRFTNRNFDAFYPTKIAANLQGNVYCVDSVVGDKTISERLIFNLLKVKSFVIKGNEMMAVGQNPKPLVTIFIGNPYTKALKKEMDALWYICDTYSKLAPKYKCD